MASGAVAGCHCFFPDPSPVVLGVALGSSADTLAPRCTLLSRAVQVDTFNAFGGIQKLLSPHLS